MDATRVPVHAEEDKKEAQPPSVSGRLPLADITRPAGDEVAVQSPPMSPPPKEASISPVPKPSSLRGMSIGSSSSANHRDSLRGENIRSAQPSPRSARHPSFSQSALADLIATQPKPGDSTRFAGRDWKDIKVGELVTDENVRFVDLDMPVEKATQILIDSGAPVIFLRETLGSRSAVGTFDYSDLNAYLLLVCGLVQPEEKDISSFQELANKAREGDPIPVKDVKDLGKKNPYTILPGSARLPQAVEILGSGVHRIAVVKEGTDEVIGVLSQLRLVKFFWENGRNFPAIDQLYPQQIKDLQIGSSQVIAINGDRPLTEALELMNNEGVSSLAVIDNNCNVVGNISIVDVKHLTRSTALPLLWSTCIHFVSVILSDRGLIDGRDPFPVFHVTPFSTLAHTVAKLIATRSHRMWVVEHPSPASSLPQTPVSQSAVLVPPPVVASPLPSPGSLPYIPPTVSASANPGALLSGRLTGVVSLTDVINLFARSSGLDPIDPTQARSQRRRDSSSSMRRSSSIDLRRSSSIDLRRSPSIDIRR